MPHDDFEKRHDPNGPRQYVAVLMLFAIGFLAYALWGVPGGAGFGFGLVAFWLGIGITSGYWIGTHGPTEQMVIELMHRIKLERASGRASGDPRA